MKDIFTRDTMPQVVDASLALRAPRPPGAAAGGMTSREVVGILRRRKWLIVLSTVILTFITAIVTFLWLRYSPVYSSSALLQIGIPKVSELTIGNPMYTQENVDRVKLSHARLVKTEAVLNQAIQDSRIRNTQWFVEKDDPFQRLLRELNVVAVPGTDFVQLSMSGPRPRELPEIINVVAEKYISYSSDVLSQQYRDDISRLKQERDRYQADLERILVEIRKARPQDIPDIERQTNVQDLQLADVTHRMLERQATQRQVDSQMRIVLRQEQEGTLTQSPEVLMMVENDQLIRSLRMTLLGYQTELENLLRKYGPEHPRYKEYKTRMAGIEHEVESKREELAKINAQSLKDARTSQYQAVSLELADVREEYKLAIATLRDLQTNLSRLRQLKAEEEALTANIEKIDARLMDLRLLSAGQGNVWMAAMAAIPREPSNPKWGINMPLGLMLGLMLGVGLAFLLELIDTSIKTPSDVARKVDLPMLGMVPHNEDLDDEFEDLRLAFLSNPKSVIGEAFRQIHTCLAFSGPAEHRRSILVTSPSPGDGRTTVAINLAAASAQAGRRVLLVDTNFHQPMIQKLFNKCPESGLSGALAGQNDWRQVICEVAPNFSAMAAGQLPANPSELLGSQRMRDLIGLLEGQFDQIIFDGAPCMVVSDPLALSTMVDAVVLVVRAGVNTHGMVQRARDMLSRVGVRIAGVVLNGVRVTPGGYLQSNYEVFYDYHQQQELAQK